MSPFFQSRDFSHPSSASPLKSTQDHDPHTSKGCQRPTPVVPKCTYVIRSNREHIGSARRQRNPRHDISAHTRYPIPTSVLFSYHIQISKKDICNLSFYKTVAGISLSQNTRIGRSTLYHLCYGYKLQNFWSAIDIPFKRCTYTKYKF